MMTEFHSFDWKTALRVLLLKKVVPECTVMISKIEKFKIADEVGEIIIMNSHISFTTKKYRYHFSIGINSHQDAYKHAYY